MRPRPQVHQHHRILQVIGFSAACTDTARSDTEDVSGSLDVLDLWISSLEILWPGGTSVSISLQAAADL